MRVIPSNDRRPLGLLFLAAAVVLTAVPARAEQKTSLVVHREPGAEDCPDVYKLATQVHAIVGREVIGSGPGQDAAWIEVTMSRKDDGYWATVRTFGPTVGERELHDTGEDCGGLGDAVAVSLALLWTSQQGTLAEPEPETDALDSKSDETDAAQAPAQKEPLSKARPTPKKPSKRVPKAAREAPDSEFTVRPGADALVGAALSVLEHPAPSARLGFRLELGRYVSVGLDAGTVGPDRLELEAGNVNLDLWYGALRACAAIRPESPRLLFCVRPTAGVLQGEGDGFDNSWKRRLSYLAVAVGLELRGTIAGSFGWAAELALLTPFERQGFSVTDSSGRRVVFSTPSLGLLALLGVCWDLHP